MVAILVCAGAGGCRPSGPHFVLRGEVTKKKVEDSAIVVKGDDIAGFMPAMTMQYKVGSSGIPANLQVGDVISADIVFAADNKSYRIENIRIVTPAASPPASGPSPPKQ